MPRKPRVRPEREVKKIEIERNVIEQFLMDIKNLAKKNRKLVVYAIVGLLVFTVIIIAAAVAADFVTTRDEGRFEKIMDEYARYSALGDSGKAKTTIADLKKFIDSTYFGFPHAMAFYALGNLYYNQKEYLEAKKYLVRFAEKEPGSHLAPMALMKGAIALEEAKDLKGALELYQRLENKYAESIMADQIFFNMARLYGKMNDVLNSRKYYNRVISGFPESAFVVQAKKRLFTLGTIQ
jgi:tetratricopeptide (TPR) repeat protein